MMYTKSDLIKMWQRTVQRQYLIANNTLLKAITATKGELQVCFSGGKDSSLLLDMYCDILSQTKYRDKPISVVFADTTNETSAIRRFVPNMIDYVENKYNVNVIFNRVKPKTTWAKYILKNGLPLISKEQSRAVSIIKNDMRKTGVDYTTIASLWRKDISAVRELFDAGFSKSGVLRMTGYISSREIFTDNYRIAKKWLPMLNCDVDLCGRCCETIKEAPLYSISKGKTGIVTGEQAQESRMRERHYLDTGCISKAPDGNMVVKPFGPMTNNGILYSIKYRNVPICSDYGDIVEENGCYRCTKAQRTGCALCGFGCHIDTQRFVRLSETDPNKVKFAFKPMDEGGAGYLEAISYMNEYCGTKVEIPKI